MSNAIIFDGTLTQARDFVKGKLATNDQWLYRGLLAIYARQTADEQDAERTQYNNGRGFGSADAEILSSFAKQVEDWNNTEPRSRKYRSPLSPRQREIARTKMEKYAMQLVRVAREGQEEPSEDPVVVDSDD